MMHHSLVYGPCFNLFTLYLFHEQYCVDIYAKRLRLHKVGLLKITRP